MYIWKCWRDTRAAFCVFLGSVIASALFHQAMVADWFGWASTATWGVPGGIWKQTAGGVFTLVFSVIPFAGFVIGALGVGGEFSRQTLPFLLTRPRSRRFFIWASWLVGAVEVCLLVVIAVILYGAGGVMQWPMSTILRAVSVISVTALLIFSITFFFTVLLRKEQHGTNAAVAAVVAYSGAAMAVWVLFGVKIPHFLELYFGAFRVVNPFPLVAIAVWLGIAILLIFAAHLVFERAEA